MKKKNVQGRSWMGYCPFSSSDRDTAGLYWPSLRAGASDSALASGSARATWSSNARDTAHSARDRVLYHNKIFVS